MGDGRWATGGFTARLQFELSVTCRKPTVHRPPSVHRSPFTVHDPMKELRLTIEGMSCEHCVRAVKSRLTATPGVNVEEVVVGAATLQYDPAKTNVEAIEEVIADEGYTAFPENAR